MEVIRENLFAHSGVRHFDCRNLERAVLVKLNWAETKYFRISSSFCSLSIDVEFDAVPAIRQFIWADPTTSINFETDGQVRSLTPTAPMVIIPGGTVYRCTPSNEHQVISLRIEIAALASVATAMLGEEVTPEKILVERWNNDFLKTGYVDEVRRFIANLDSFTEPNSFAAETFGQALLLKFMMGSTSDFAARFRTKVASPSLCQLKAIEEYIASNWQTGIDVEDIAQKFGVSVRSIFRYFRSLRGITPFDFIKTLKLDRARGMLQSADQEDGVMRIALRCGFQGMGHFAREYQKRFGELPSQTLRRAKKPSSPQTKADTDNGNHGGCDGGDGQDGDRFAVVS